MRASLAHLPVRTWIERVRSAWRSGLLAPRGSLRETYLRVGLLVAVVALAVQGAVALFLLQAQRETLAARRLGDLALPLAVQFRELLQTGLSPDEALGRLRPQGLALGVEIAILSPAGRVLRDSGSGLLEGVDTALSTEQLPSTLGEPHYGVLRIRRGEDTQYRFVAFGVGGLRLPAGRPDVGGLLIAERADRRPLSTQALALPLAQGALVALVAAAVVTYLLARRFARSAERLVAETQASLAIDRAPSVADGPHELRVLARHLGRLYEEHSRTQRGARNLVTALGQALREPLSNIRAGMREVMRAQSASSEERQVALRLLDQELRRVQQLVAQLLALARLETQQVEMAHQRVDLAALAAETVAAASEHAALRNVQTVFDSDRQPVLVAGDADRLEQALRALLDHALRESPDGGTVTVSVGLFAPEETAAIEASAGGPRDAYGPHAWLSVHYPGDSGIVGDPQRLFDLSSLEATDSGAVADRLALAIAREIVHAHGGRVLAEGNAVAGARLAFILPALRAASVGDTVSETSPEGVWAPRPLDTQR